MIKKAIFGAGVAMVLGLLFLGRDAVSYMRTSAGYVKESVAGNVPIEFELQRARDMINGLLPEIRQNMHQIAKGEVEVEQLAQQIARSETELAKDKEQIMRLKTDLVSGDSSYEYAGRRYTVSQVKMDLANRFDRFQTAEATLTSMRQIYEARQKALDAARAKLEGKLAEKRNLAVQVEELEAKMQTLAAAQTTSDYNFDDSQLGRAKALIADLKKRLEVDERLIDAEGKLHDEIPMEDEAPADIVERVTAYFAEPAPDAEAVAQVEAEKPAAN